MNDPFHPTADTRPMPRPWGDVALICLIGLLCGLTIGHVASKLMSETIAAEIEARKFIGGQP